MPPERTFSFEDDHDGRSSVDEQERPGRQYVISSSQPNQEPSMPSSASSPPQYASFHAVPGPVTPVAHHPTRARHSRSRSRNGSSIDLTRKPLPHPVDDEIPPPPPPHRRSPTRETNMAVSLLAPALDGSNPPSPTRGSHHGAEVAYRDHPAREQDVTREDTRPSFQSGRGAVPLQRPTSRLPEHSSYASNLHLTAGAATPGSLTPPVASSDMRSSRHSGRSVPVSEFSSPHQYEMSPYGNYHDSPYQSSSLTYGNAVGGADINPYAIADDGDDGFMPEPKRKSMLPMSRERLKTPVGAGHPAPTGIAAAGAGAGALGGLFARQQKTATASGSYDPISSSPDASGSGAEKSAWLSKQTKNNSKMRLLVGILIALVIVLAVIGGIVGGVLGSRSAKASGGGSSGGDTNNAADDAAANGDLGLDSAEIQKLMNNKNLHKVFPGIDYTPWGTQYPLCHTYPPSQNNVTRDMAVLSQLTNAVRLYGTDCNQTEMVLHAIDRLQLKDMKVWLGVWIDTNQTTSDRQLAQMYDILRDVQDRSVFKGAIVGNEALYRAGVDKTQSEQELITVLQAVRSNFSTLGYDIPVATSDLGDNWNGQLVDVVDYVMSNIHPFFAGVTADVAAGWTWDFWDQHDRVLTQGLSNPPEQLISETGWPSGGGTDCGGTTGKCATGQSGAVASVENMNVFMNDWVCQALENGTEYFWFEAFDEPWKVVYNTADQAWEDKWGLMDPGRNLKSGIRIPDCGGKTVS